MTDYMCHSVLGAGHSASKWLYYPEFKFYSNVQRSAMSSLNVRMIAKSQLGGVTPVGGEGDLTSGPKEGLLWAGRDR